MCSTGKFSAPRGNCARSDKTGETPPAGDFVQLNALAKSLALSEEGWIDVDDDDTPVVVECPQRSKFLLSRAFSLRWPAGGEGDLIGDAGEPADEARPRVPWLPE